MSNTRRLVWFALGFVLGGTIAAKAYADVFNPERYWEESKYLAEFAAIRGCVAAGKPLKDCQVIGAIIKSELDAL